MASLRKHKGRYSVRFYDSDRFPKRKEISLGTNRKSVAEPKLRRWEEAYARGDFDPWNGGWLVENETISDAVDRFLEAKERDGLQKSTVEAYEYKLNAFAKHTPTGAMVRDVQPDHVHSYVHARVNEGQRTSGRRLTPRCGAATGTCGRSSRGLSRTNSWTKA